MNKVFEIFVSSRILSLFALNLILPFTAGKLLQKSIILEVGILSLKIGECLLIFVSFLAKEISSSNSSNTSGFSKTE